MSIFSYLAMNFKLLLGLIVSMVHDQAGRI